MLLIDQYKKKAYKIIEIKEFKQDLVTAFNIEVVLHGIIYPNEFYIPRDDDNLRDVLRYLILEVYPFGQQLCRIIPTSHVYDYQNETTTVKINLNEWAYDFKHMVFDARMIEVNTAWREAVYKHWTRDRPWSQINSFKVIGPMGETDITSVTITDFTNLCMPLSEIYRQMILNNNYMAIPNPALNLVNIRKRVGIKRHILLDECINIEDDYKDTELPLGIQFKTFIKDSVDPTSAYPDVAYYEFRYNDNIERFEAIHIGKSSEEWEFYAEGIEKVLVESQDYSVDDDPLLRSIAEERLNNLEYNNNVTITIAKDTMTMRQFNLRIIFSHLGELFHLHLQNNNIMSGKLTSIKYDFNTELFTLVFGTKRMNLTDILKKEIF